MNPRWNEPVGLSGTLNEDERFEEASAMCGKEFVEQLEFLTGAWQPARDQVEAALRARQTVHESGQVLLFDTAGMPWKDHLYELERLHSVQHPVLFVIFMDSAKMWRVQAVTEEVCPFI